ncbi:daptomycin-sensing surface protein LiaX [uncultured Enterococcus sp.]|uniref:daptomycin-sensing surface protein LiaX n=1 Tax=uncultured Enterococcus sp. TaxID=167972 RepID=UPI0025CE09D5|nr:daptomycin-sensing surface protein LiaX [uncultured Enterococcus sp.]
MNERKRILDLVKKGVLSTEEALDLLEGIAQDKDASQIEKAAEQVKANKAESQPSDEADFIDEKKQEQDLEAILDELASKTTRISADLDRVQEQINLATKERQTIKDTLTEYYTHEELEDASLEEIQVRERLEKEVKQLDLKLETLHQERSAFEEEMKAIRRDQWTYSKEKMSQKFDIPEDWKEQASEKLTTASEKVVEHGTKLSKALFRTLQNVSDSISENVEWKDFHMKVPGVASTKFDKEFSFEPTDATILDVKIANGTFRIKRWDEAFVKVDAKIKLYGKFHSENPEALFAERSQLEVDHETIRLHVPNKRVRADLTVYLPIRVYDHVSIKMLNGTIEVEELEAKDVYMKTTNGDIVLHHIDATMLELEGVNGSIGIEAGTIRDTVIENINGAIILTTTPETALVSLVNGDVKLTFEEETLRKLQASSVNGDVKVALSPTLGLAGVAKTNIGAVQSRLTNYEIIREKREKMNQLLEFERITENMAQIDVSTTTGSVYLKDTQA